MKGRIEYRVRRERLSPFFMGRIYPASVCALALLGYTLSIEFFSNILILLSLAAALLVSPSVRPLVCPFLVIFFQLSPSHSPSSPVFSDYLTRPCVLFPTLFALLSVVAALVFCLIRAGAFKDIGLASFPFLIPSGAFAAALLLNGAFSDAYTPRNLVIALAEIAGFFLVFYLFYFGFKSERGEALVDYFIFVSFLLCMLLTLESLWLYATGGVISEGSIVKENLFYGWGIWNTCGQALTVTIPVLFLGAMRGRAPWLYLGGAAIAFCAVLLTLSRSALLVSVLAIAACAVIGCFFGKNKRIFRIAVPIFLLGALALGIFFFDEVSVLLLDLFERGLSDNGRFALWGAGTRGFLESPIFGKGFFGFERAAAENVHLYIDFFPRMLHNTVIELLGATGAFGLLCYLFYRGATVREFILKPSLAKTMLGISVLTLIAQSLLDNFIFYVQPMFYYSIALALAVKLGEGGEPENL